MYNNDTVQEKNIFILCGSEILKKMHHHPDVVICSGKNFGLQVFSLVWVWTVRMERSIYEGLTSNNIIGLSQECYAIGFNTFCFIFDISKLLKPIVTRFLLVKMLDHCEDSFGYSLLLLVVPILGCLSHKFISC